MRYGVRTMSAQRKGTIMTEEKICETCRWWAHDPEEGWEHYCICIDSPLAGEDTRAEERCKKWEGM